jgi:hypothetical protein
LDAAQRAASGAANKIIVTLECRDCSYDDFAVVWRVLNGLYVPFADLVNGARVLDLAEALLVDCANKDNEEFAARAAASAAARTPRPRKPSWPGLPSRSCAR